MGATGLYSQTQDMVRLGGLFLSRGCWNQRRILSQEWVDLVNQREYEFYWNGPDHKSYGKSGMLGQRLTSLPDEGRAVAWHGYGGEHDGDIQQFIETYKGD